MPCSHPTSTPDNPDLIRQLLRQLETQTQLARSAVRGMQRAMKQLEKERAEHQKNEPAFLPTDEDFEDSPEESEEERRTKEAEEKQHFTQAQQKRLDYLRRLFRHYPLCPEDERGSAPDIEAHVLGEDIRELYPLTESMFRVLLRRDFSPEAEQCYLSHNMHRTVYERIVNYYVVAVRHDALTFAEPELLAAAEELENQEKAAAANKALRALAPTSGDFRLQGRADIEEFFNREVVDIVNNHAAYRALGIDFPQSFVLEGPPGCGKTYAVNRLAEHLNWHTNRIDSSAIGSSYVHGTARLIEEKFDEAEKHAPSLLIIDEMDAFMPDRAGCHNSDSHSIEEVAAFLRRLQTAAEKHILVIGMTNRKDVIDPAILRTGRFGAHLTVAMPSCEEVEAVLAHALSTRSHEAFPLRPIAEQLLNRPLSDITHLVDRAAMHTARHHRTSITAADLTAALAQLQALTNTPPRRSMGFAS